MLFTYFLRALFLTGILCLSGGLGLPTSLATHFCHYQDETPFC